MKLYAAYKPNAWTLVDTIEVKDGQTPPPAPHAERTRQEIDAYITEQLALGWAPVLPPHMTDVIPAMVPQWHFWQALAESHPTINRDSVRAVINTLQYFIDNPVAKAKALADMDMADNVLRSSPLLPVLQAVFGLTSDDVDAVFVLANYKVLNPT